MITIQLCLTTVLLVSVHGFGQNTIIELRNSGYSTEPISGITGPEINTVTQEIEVAPVPENTYGTTPLVTEENSIVDNGGYGQYANVITEKRTNSKYVAECREDGCCDGHRLCKWWSEREECNLNFDWMQKNCKLSCGNCEVNVPVPEILIEEELYVDIPDFRDDKIELVEEVEINRNPIDLEYFDTILDVSAPAHVHNMLDQMRPHHFQPEISNPYEEFPPISRDIPIYYNEQQQIETIGGNIELPGYGPEVPFDVQEIPATNENSGSYGEVLPAPLQPQPYTQPESYILENYAPEPHALENYAPEANAFENYAPEAYAFENYAPVAAAFENYAPEANAFENYEPELYVPQKSYELEEIAYPQAPAPEIVYPQEIAYPVPPPQEVYYQPPSPPQQPLIFERPIPVPFPVEVPVPIPQPYLVAVREPGTYQKSNQTTTEPGDCIMGGWSEWTQCSRSCGEGEQSRSRAVDSQPDEDGRPCPDTIQVKKCVESQCTDAADCEVSSWTRWTPCSTECGAGVQLRTRQVIIQAQNGGARCPDLLEQKECLKPCTSGEGSDRDCLLTDWGEWSECPPCGSGQRFRLRNVRQPALGDGESCPAVDDLQEIEMCDFLEPCSDGVVEPEIRIERMPFPVEVPVRVPVVVRQPVVIRQHVFHQQVPTVSRKLLNPPNVGAGGYGHQQSSQAISGPIVAGPFLGQETHGFGQGAGLGGRRFGSKGGCRGLGCSLRTQKKCRGRKC